MLGEKKDGLRLGSLLTFLEVKHLRLPFEIKKNLNFSNMKNSRMPFIL